jgi:hypothetical protein
MKERELIIAIDPGLKGGVAVAYNDAPCYIAPLGRTPKEILETFIEIGLPKQLDYKVKVLIEDVHSMPGMRSQSMFTFGRNLGHIEGVLSTLGFTELIRIPPKEWQLFFDMKKHKGEKQNLWKQRLLKKSISLAPELWRKNINLTTADAFLILYYYLETYEKK